MSSRISAGTPTITVRVTLFADLKRYLPKGIDGPQTYTLNEGATVTDLFDAVGITDREDVTVGRNGDQAQHESLLRDGDDIVLFSPMEGG